MLLREFVTMFEGINVQSSALLSTTGVASEMAEKIEMAISSWGEGARGFILGQWRVEGAGGHYFSVEVGNGKVMFVDGQNSKNDVKGYFEGLSPPSIFWGRLDNLKPTDKVITAVKNRGA